MNEHTDSGKSVKSDEDRLRRSGRGAEISAWRTDDERLLELADEVRRRYSKRRRLPIANPAH